jgi:uncharacterized protein YjbI with pentapeptide repeats
MGIEHLEPNGSRAMPTSHFNIGRDIPLWITALACAQYCCVNKDNGKGSDGFEPPKYIANLIAAVNDGAKAAQAGALFFALVGLYLLATAFSASDEDLLLGRTMTISQIGATLPVSFSFAIAPFVFVFLHIYTLVRYDLLAANVRQFLAELPETVPLEADRERSRQLLANIEFIQALVVPPRSRLYSPVWRWLVRSMVAIFPVVVLLLVQINALRYQSELITGVQRLWLVLDLAALVWFLNRNPLRGSASRFESRGARACRWVGLLWLPVTVIGLDLIYLNVVPADADRRLVHYKGFSGDLRENVADVVRQPLDVMLCFSLSWGCRYLKVEHRALFDKVWDNNAIPNLRMGAGDPQRSLSGVEGIFLRQRNLRFAALGESQLYAADLIEADLRWATFQPAEQQGAKLPGAQLTGAVMRGTKLQGADLGRAYLQSADLSGAQLTGANLQEAQLQGANLSGAQLRGANLSFARLHGAFMWDVQLQGANLSGAVLDGADLSGAQLQGANFQGAELFGADLTDTFLWRTNFGNAKLELADLRGAYCTEPGVACDDEQREPPEYLEFYGANILVDANSVFTKVVQGERRAKDEATYDLALAPFLVDTVAANDLFALAGIAQRDGFGGQNPPARQKYMSRSEPTKPRTLYLDLSCGISRKIKERNVQLDRRVLFLVNIISPDCLRWCSDYSAHC